ncbi:hypothetical protein LOK49_LG14G00879 [Camellia lanceoleosa]|uniref:Uncharacterized protein n=1 Tax=Camellia lanceoleosa TaxID=1840588 RepID=A0ACC0FEH0_9ERIC|nr:hypothetical protein LOK49_LG14G00879 [Camellia lanceoleosa]
MPHSSQGYKPRWIQYRTKSHPQGGTLAFSQRRSD